MNKLLSESLLGVTLVHVSIILRNYSVGSASILEKSGIFLSNLAILSAISEKKIVYLEHMLTDMRKGKLVSTMIMSHTLFMVGPVKI